MLRTSWMMLVGLLFAVNSWAILGKLVERSRDVLYIEFMADGVVTPLIILGFAAAWERNRNIDGALRALAWILGVLAVLNIGGCVGAALR